MSIIMKWFPPSWYQIRTETMIIYIDPAYLKKHFVTYSKKIEFASWPDPIDGLPEDLEKGDFILITHHHKDHCKQVTVNRLLDHDTVVVAPKVCKKELGEQIRVISAGEAFTHRGLHITAVEAYNTEQGNSTKKVHKKGQGVGYLLSIMGRTFYHAGDTDLIPEMKVLGSVDVAMMPIGGRFTMDIEEAAKAVHILKPKFVFPMHLLGADPLEFKRIVESQSDIQVVVLETGEFFELD